MAEGLLEDTRNPPTTLHAKRPLAISNQRKGKESAEICLYNISVEDLSVIVKKDSSRFPDVCY